jgi:transcriptional regulator GlxA family with amidase domain
MDLCLHLVAIDHGADVAVRVARRIVMPPHRAGGQAQYVDQRIDAQPTAEPLGAVLDWARSKLDSGVDVGDVARRASVSPRTLTRRFRRATGLPPGEWLARERLRLAQRLLETCTDSLTVVARNAGYDSETTMRAQFAGRLGTSPRAYRQSFGRQAASSEPR